MVTQVTRPAGVGLLGGGWVRWTTVALAGATVVSALFAAQAFLSWPGAGPHDWWRTFAAHSVPWYAWALFLPAIVALARRFPLASGSLERAVPANAAGALLLVPAHIAVTLLIWQAAGLTAYVYGAAPVELRAMLAGRLASELLTYTTLVCLVQLALDRREVRDRAMASTRLATRVAQAELESLRAQLCPHFLFNALNATSALVTSDPEGAERMLARLSGLLRTALGSEGINEVPLESELVFARRYLDVEQMRFGDRLAVRYDVKSETLNALVPNFLLQPIVENAIHHGFAERPGPLSITIRTMRSGERLTLRVEDDGPGLSPDAPRRKGIGLRNTRARLEHLYGERFVFDLRNRPEGGAVAEIDVPFRLGAVENGEAEAVAAGLGPAPTLAEAAR